jgi:hypothetical protein
MRRLGSVGHDKPALAHAGHMVRHPVKDAAHDHLVADLRHIRVKHGRAIGTGKDGLANVLANFACINIDAKHKFNITGAVSTDLVVDQAAGRIVLTIEIHTLD